MSVALTREKLLELVSGRSSETRERIPCRGVAHRVDEIRGGELFIELPGGLCGTEHTARAAFDRGAAICLAASAPEEPFDQAQGAPFGGARGDPFPEPERLVLVEDPIAAYAKLAAYWRSQVGCKVVAVDAELSDSSLPGLIAGVLLRSGKGTYSLPAPDPLVEMASALLRLSADHGWCVVELPAPGYSRMSEALRLASPEVLIAASEASLGELAGAAPEAVSQSCPIVKLDGGAVARLEGAGRLSFGDAQGCDARVSSVKLELRATRFRLDLGKDGTDLKIRLLGRAESINAAGAALTARVVAPQLGLEQIKGSLEEHIDATSPMSYLELDDDARVILDRRPPSSGVVRELAGLAGELKSGGLKVGVLLCFSEPPVPARLIEEVCAAGPDFLAIWGARADRAGDPSVFSASTAEDLASELRSREFNVLLVRGCLPEDALQSVVLSWQAGRTTDPTGG